MSVALAAQLREGTKKSHTMAENTGFVSCFLKGVVDKASYRKLVADLYFVYTAMEEEIGKLGDHPVVAPIGMKELNRREALEQDLTYYFGANWRDQIQASPSAAVYVDRIHAIAKAPPELLLRKVHRWHMFLSHIWGSGQDQVAVIKRQLQHLMPEVRRSLPEPPRNHTTHRGLLSLIV